MVPFSESEFPVECLGLTAEGQERSAWQNDKKRRRPPDLILFAFPVSGIHQFSLFVTAALHSHTHRQRYRKRHGIRQRLTIFAECLHFVVSCKKLQIQRQPACQQPAALYPQRHTKPTNACNYVQCLLCYYIKRPQKNKVQRKRWFQFKWNHISVKQLIIRNATEVMCRIHWLHCESWTIWTCFHSLNTAFASCFPPPVDGPPESHHGWFREAQRAQGPDEYKNCITISVSQSVCACVRSYPRTNGFS